MVEIVYRSVKGANLVAAEVDANFQELEDRIAAVISSAPQPIEIIEIVVNGDQMTIVMADYSTFGPFTLPTAVMNWTGEWQPNHQYAANELFTYQDNMYITTVAYLTGPAFVNGAHYQLIMPIPSVFDVGFFFPQRPGYGIPSEEPMCAYLAARPFYFELDAPGSVARLRVDPALELIFVIYKGATDIGSITFAAGATNGTIEMDATAFAAGDILRIHSPTVVDDDALDLSVTLVGHLGEP